MSKNIKILSRKQANKIVNQRCRSGRTVYAFIYSGRTIYLNKLSYNKKTNRLIAQSLDGHKITTIFYSKEKIILASPENVRTIAKQINTY